ncbi:MAG: metal-dependent transcriptional regulator [Chloroflexi bacterium]|nr:metal-dependent transcriptional regulator [Chloroflexota bacterium]
MLKLPPQDSTHAESVQTETREMILLTLIRGEENGRFVSSAELARELNADVSVDVRLLIEQSFVCNDSTGLLCLTQTGRDKARGLLRRHRLAERLFTDVLNLDWARAHEEADKLEHSLSSTAEAQLATTLGYPDTCPHGNPIPSGPDSASDSRSMPLTECLPLTDVTIVRIGSETPAALQHLATLGLLPNVEIAVENKAPFDGPVLIRVGRAHYALGHNLAARIWVTLSN